MSLTAEQRDLRDAVRGLLARTAPDSLWPRLCEPGPVADCPWSRERVRRLTWG